MDGVEPRVELDAGLFAALLRREPTEYPGGDVQEGCTVIRYCETRDGIRTGRFVTVAIRWDDGDFLIQWPPIEKGD